MNIFSLSSFGQKLILPSLRLTDLVCGESKSLYAEIFLKGDRFGGDKTKAISIKRDRKTGSLAIDNSTASENFLFSVLTGIGPFLHVKNQYTGAVLKISIVCLYEKNKPNPCSVHSDVSFTISGCVS